MACNCLAFAVRYWAWIALLLIERPDQAAGDIANHGLRLEQMIHDEGLRGQRRR